MSMNIFKSGQVSIKQSLDRQIRHSFFFPNRDGMDEAELAALREEKKNEFDHNLARIQDYLQWEKEQKMLRGETVRAQRRALARQTSIHRRTRNSLVNHLHLNDDSPEAFFSTFNEMTTGNMKGKASVFEVDDGGYCGVDGVNWRKVKKTLVEFLLSPISQDNKLFRYWQYASLRICIFSLLVDTFLFGYSSFFDEKIGVIIRTLCDCLNCVHIYLMFRMSYWRCEGGTWELCRSKSKIAQRYLRTWFVVDLLTVFPFYAFAKDNAGEFVALIPRLLKFRKLMEVKDSNVSMYDGLVQNLTIFLVTCHSLSCMIAFIDLKYAMNGCRLTHQFVYDNGNVLQIYLELLANTAQDIADMGSGEESCSIPYSIVQLIISLVGMFVFAAILGNINSYISFQNTAKSEYLATRQTLTSYLRNSKVDPKLQARCDKALKVGFYNQQKEINRILELLPEHIQNELKIARFRHYIELIPCIRFMSMPTKERICLSIRSLFFLQDTSIVFTGERKSSAFIFIRGLAEYGPLPVTKTVADKRRKSRKPRSVARVSIDNLVEHSSGSRENFPRGKDDADDEEEEAMEEYHFEEYKSGDIFSQESLLAGVRNVKMHYRADCITRSFCEVVRLDLDTLLEVIKDDDNALQLLLKTQSEAERYLKKEKEQLNAARKIQAAVRKFLQIRRLKKGKMSILTALMSNTLVANYTLREEKGTTDPLGGHEEEDYDKKNETEI